jgi:hypothetical protein
MKRDACSTFFEDHELAFFVRAVDMAALQSLLKVAGGLSLRGSVAGMIRYDDLHVRAERPALAG